LIKSPLTSALGGAPFPKRNSFFPTRTRFDASHIGIEISCAARWRARDDPRLTEASHGYAWVNRKDIGRNPNAIEPNNAASGFVRCSGSNGDTVAT
jgi:hypothetical protein